jgi:hypothetical protein
LRSASRRVGDGDGAGADADDVGVGTVAGAVSPVVAATVPVEVGVSSTEISVCSGGETNEANRSYCADKNCRVILGDVSFLFFFHAKITLLRIPGYFARIPSGGGAGAGTGVGLGGVSLLGYFLPLGLTGGILALDT